MRGGSPRATGYESTLDFCLAAYVLAQAPRGSVPVDAEERPHDCTLDELGIPWKMPPGWAVEVLRNRRQQGNLCLVEVGITAWLTLDQLLVFVQEGAAVEVPQ